MKNLILSLTIFTLFVSSCDVLSVDEEKNQNPNLPTEASASQLISNAMLSLPALSSSPEGEYLAQYLSETAYVDNSLYPQTSTSFYWLYQGPLVNLEAAIDNANTANEAAVAKILKGYYFWHITDRWGDVPYTEALAGVDNFTPAYNTQQAVYDSVFTLLAEAGNELDLAGSLENDVIYGGEMAKWQKLSNTIRMLMALRLSEVDEERARTEFNAALDAGVMESNDDNLVFQHLADANNENYWYNQIVRQSREWWAISERFMSMLEPQGDPRLSVYADTALAEGVGYVGLPFGTTDDDLLNTQDYSLLGADIHEQDAPVYLITHAQALFAQAEAAARGWTTGDAQALYNSAIEQSVLQWTGSDEGLAAYLGQADVAYNATTEEEAIEQIAEQRYIHLFMNGYEAWAEWRRTGYPDNMVNPNGREVPLRQSYTPDEALNNTENYNQAVDRQFNGEDTIYGRLWWDVE